MSEIRSAHWWQAYLEQKLKGWQIRRILPRKDLDPITIVGDIQGVRVEGRNDMDFDLTFVAQIQAMSVTMDPYNWEWARDVAPFSVLLTETDLIKIEEVDEKVGGASFVLKDPELILFLVPPSADLYLHHTQR